MHHVCRCWTPYDPMRQWRTNAKALSQLIWKHHKWEQILSHDTHGPGMGVIATQRQQWAHGKASRIYARLINRSIRKWFILRNFCCRMPSRQLQHHLCPSPFWFISLLLCHRVPSAPRSMLCLIFGRSKATTPFTEFIRWPYFVVAVALQNRPTTSNTKNLWFSEQINKRQQPPSERKREVEGSRS